MLAVLLAVWPVVNMYKNIIDVCVRAYACMHTCMGQVFCQTGRDLNPLMLFQVNNVLNVPRVSRRTCFRVCAMRARMKPAALDQAPHLAACTGKDSTYAVALLTSPGLLYLPISSHRYRQQARGGFQAKEKV